MADSIVFFERLTNQMWGSGPFQYVFYLSLVVILFLEKDKMKKFRYVWFSVFILLFIYNPIMIKVSEKIFGAAELSSYYCRFFLMMPMMFAIAYALTLLVKRTDGMKRFIIVVVMMILIGINGTTVYSQDWYHKAENINKVPRDVLVLSSILGENHPKVKILVPLDMHIYFRQVDAAVELVYGRMYDQTDIVNAISSEYPDAEYVMEFARENGCDYIVCANNAINMHNFLNAGGFYIGESTNYMLIEVL